MTDVDKQCMQRLDAQYCGRPLTEQELESCYNCLRHSQHTRLRIMPNHHVDDTGALQGFMFTCSTEDKASVLPIGPKMFQTTAVYEVKSSTDKSFNEDALKIISDMASSRESMQRVAEGLKNDHPALFDCIGESDVVEDSFAPIKIEDQRSWTESVPYKMGIYHTFSRSYSNDRREHKVFVVVSGTLIQAAEQLYNLWIDCGEEITSKEFVNSEEARWLKTATIRSLNRVAARIADQFGLKLHMVTDYEDPCKCRMALPSLVTRHNDMDYVNDQVRVSNSAALTDTLDSGVIFDVFGAEGYWIFLGPRNTTEFSLFGSMLAHRSDAQAFPTRTVRYNALYDSLGATSTVKVRADSDSQIVIHEGLESALLGDSDCTLYNEFMIPDERFYRITEMLGFNRNDGIMNLMPLVCYVNDEPLRVDRE